MIGLSAFMNAMVLPEMVSERDITVIRQRMHYS